MSTDIGTLDRRQAVKALLADRRNVLVVTGLGSPGYDTFAAGDHDANFYLWGAMGGAAMTGLGLALAQPNRPVAVITGDGEQLMGAGALITIAVKQPANLSIVVLDNGHYGETGMQVSHTGLGVDLAEVARAAGIAHSVTIEDEAGIARFRAEIHLATGGPRFARIKIACGPVARALPARDGVYLKQRFRRHLGFEVS